MIIRSRILGQQDIASIMVRVSAHYAHNLMWEVETQTRTATRLKVGTVDSYAHGSRTSGSGRHGRWACWHVFRDVIAAIMAADPAATVRTGVTVYRGADGFLDTFPDTAWNNVGSLARPATLVSMCVDCTGPNAARHGGPFVTTLI